MINHNLLSRLSIGALVATIAAEPTLAHAGACAGTRVAWGSTSDTLGNLTCGMLASRGESIGAFRSQGGISIPFSLSVRLISGIHASAIGYDAFGNPLSGCSPLDASTADGFQTVSGAACAGGKTQQVIVVF